MDRPAQEISKGGRFAFFSMASNSHILIQVEARNDPTLLMMDYFTKKAALDATVTRRTGTVLLLISRRLGERSIRNP